jgi:hypothetical protein
MNAARAVELVLAEARRYAGVKEQPAGSNRGVEVDYFVREAGLDPKGGYPWCACFVGQIGRQALGAAWPCPRSALVADLAAWAKTEAGAGVLVEQPAAGDLFLLWFAKLSRFAHIGFVTAVTARGYTTLEGNAAPPDATSTREGFGVFARTRAVGRETRFIRWVKAMKEDL